MIKTSEIELMLNPQSEINFAPESLESEIAQNLITIFTTSKYSVPLDREFGLNTALLDLPMTSAKALLANEIVSGIEKLEPRVKVSQVSFTGGMDGSFYPVIKFMIKN